jgi:hypothetical protein
MPFDPADVQSVLDRLQEWLRAENRSEASIPNVKRRVKVCMLVVGPYPTTSAVDGWLEDVDPKERSLMRWAWNIYCDYCAAANVPKQPGRPTGGAIGRPVYDGKLPPPIVCRAIDTLCAALPREPHDLARLLRWGDYEPDFAEGARFSFRSRSIPIPDSAKRAMSEIYAWAQPGGVEYPVIPIVPEGKYPVQASLLKRIRAFRSMPVIPPPPKTAEPPPEAAPAPPPAPVGGLIQEERKRTVLFALHVAPHITYESALADQHRVSPPIREAREPGVPAARVRALELEAAVPAVPRAAGYRGRVVPLPTSGRERLERMIRAARRAPAGKSVPHTAMAPGRAPAAVPAHESRTSPDASPDPSPDASPDASPEVHYEAYSEDPDAHPNASHEAYSDACSDASPDAVEEEYFFPEG